MMHHQKESLQVISLQALVLTWRHFNIKNQKVSIFVDYQQGRAVQGLVKKEPTINKQAVAGMIATGIAHQVYGNSLEI